MMIHEDRLWSLVDKWRESANGEREPYLNPNPAIAFAQALNTAAEDLSDLLLDEGGE